MGTQISDIRVELLMDAGNGAQKAGDILVKAFAHQGNYVFIEPIIPAEISPPKRTPHSLSGAVIRLAENELTNIGSYSDVMLVEHEILLNRRLEDKEYAKNATIILDMGEQKRSAEGYETAINKAKEAGLNVIQLEMDEESKTTIKELRGNGKNMFYLGCLTAIFDIDKQFIHDAIKTTFKKLKPAILDLNLSIYSNGYDYAQNNLDLRYNIQEAESSDQQVLMDGNMALSAGIVDAGIKFFSGYPITPASTIMHSLAKSFPSYGGIVHQAEDEISAIGAVVGSYFGGVPAITATAGPGLSLKQEFIGLAMSSETPLIVINVQRGGPSTGLPTRTEQSDLFAAAFGSHGDNTKVVLSVSNAIDCFYAPHAARYLTEKLRVPVIIMSDYIISVSYNIFEKPALNQLGENSEEIDDAILERFGISRITADVPMVKTNQANPGIPDKMRRITGLNTDETGQVVYTPQSNERAHNIRNEKIHLVREALKEPESFGDLSGGDVLVVGWGSTRGVIKEAVEACRHDGLKVAGLNLKVVYPLPLMLKDIFSRFKRVVTAEVAYGNEYKPAPLAYCLRAETLCDVESAIAVPTGRPLKPSQIIDMLKEHLNG